MNFLKNKTSSLKKINFYKNHLLTINDNQNPKKFTYILKNKKKNYINFNGKNTFTLLNEKNNVVFFYKKKFSNLILINQELTEKIKKFYFFEVFKSFQKNNYLPVKVYKIIKNGKIKQKGIIFSFMGGFFFIKNKKFFFLKKKNKLPFFQWKKTKNIKVMDILKVPAIFLKTI